MTKAYCNFCCAGKIKLTLRCYQETYQNTLIFKVLFVVIFAVIMIIIYGGIQPDGLVLSVHKVLINTTALR